MMQRPTLFFVFVSMGVGLGLFQLKYEVMNLEQDHKRIHKTIRETKEAIHVLKAEWAHLNDPKRLQNLCERYLTNSPIRGNQLVSFQQVTGGKPGKAPGYDRGALDQLVADVVSDSTMTVVEE